MFSLHDLKVGLGLVQILEFWCVYSSLSRISSWWRWPVLAIIFSII